MFLFFFMFQSILNSFFGFETNNYNFRNFLYIIQSLYIIIILFPKNGSPPPPKCCPKSKIASKRPKNYQHFHYVFMILFVFYFSLLFMYIIELFGKWKKFYQKVIGLSSNLKVDTYSENVGHFGAPRQLIWNSDYSRCGIAGGILLPQVPRGWYHIKQILKTTIFF